ncbi:hypothetical protein FA15DRAFT_757761 [Coprinopsis marcescibilis]|uniref:Uncharacterized protein n=1 Tax=Coprinopsis marcescibilis TaxID=230819 RepID=A0A5C3KQT3_COPMA|nr:hypothetical protein FA15DRAFT_757761 [Coprinopsis marcescibilis]
MPSFLVVQPPSMGNHRSDVPSSSSSYASSASSIFKFDEISPALSVMSDATPPLTPIPSSDTKVHFSAGTEDKQPLLDDGDAADESLSYEVFDPDIMSVLPVLFTTEFEHDPVTVLNALARELQGDKSSKTMQILNALRTVEPLRVWRERYQRKLGLRPDMTENVMETARCLETQPNVTVDSLFGVVAHDYDWLYDVDMTPLVPPAEFARLDPSALDEAASLFGFTNDDTSPETVPTPYLIPMPGDDSPPPLFLSSTDLPQNPSKRIPSASEEPPQSQMFSFPPSNNLTSMPMFAVTKPTTPTSYMRDVIANAPNAGNSSVASSVGPQRTQRHRVSRYHSYQGKESPRTHSATPPNMRTSVSVPVAKRDQPQKYRMMPGMQLLASLSESYQPMQIDNMQPHVSTSDEHAFVNPTNFNLNVDDAFSLEALANMESKLMASASLLDLAIKALLPETTAPESISGRDMSTEPASRSTTPRLEAVRSASKIVPTTPPAKLSRMPYTTAPRPKVKAWSTNPLLHSPLRRSTVFGGGMLDVSETGSPRRVFPVNLASPGLSPSPSIRSLQMRPAASMPSNLDQAQQVPHLPSVSSYDQEPSMTSAATLDGLFAEIHDVLQDVKVIRRNRFDPQLKPEPTAMTIETIRSYRPGSFPSPRPISTSIDRPRSSSWTHGHLTGRERQSVSNGKLYPEYFNLQISNNAVPSTTLSSGKPAMTAPVKQPHYISGISIGRTDMLPQAEQRRSNVHFIPALNLLGITDPQFQGAPRQSADQHAARDELDDAGSESNASSVSPPRESDCRHRFFSTGCHRNSCCCRNDSTLTNLNYVELQCNPSSSSRIRMAEDQIDNVSNSSGSVKHSFSPDHSMFTNGLGEMHHSDVRHLHTIPEDIWEERLTRSRSLPAIYDAASHQAQLSTALSDKSNLKHPNPRPTNLGSLNEPDTSGYNEVNRSSRHRRRRKTSFSAFLSRIQSLFSLTKPLKQPALHV